MYSLQGCIWRRESLTAGLASFRVMEKEMGPRSLCDRADLTTASCAVDWASVQQVLLDTTIPPSSWRLPGSANPQATACQQQEETNVA